MSTLDRRPTHIEIARSLRDGAYHVLDEFALRAQMYELTTRLNPGEPRFDDDAPFNFEHWYISTDLERRRFGALKVFPSHVFRGEPSLEEREPLGAATTTRVTVLEPLSARAPTRVGRADDLVRGHKLLVDLPNAKLAVWRDPGGVRAFHRICPHRGIDLADGYHDEERIFCPGHGVAFAWADGSARCAAFRLRRVEAFDRDGDLYVRAGPERGD